MSDKVVVNEALILCKPCVQVNIDKPLINSVMIGKMVQQVQYEGINMLYFARGSLGHRKGYCLALIRNTGCSNMNTPSSNAPKNHNSSESLEGDQLAVSLKDTKSINPSREGDEIRSFCIWEVRPFHFQLMWLSHDGFPSIVREAWEGNYHNVCHAVDSFTQKAKSSNKEVFGNIFWKKRILSARLIGAEKPLANTPS